LRRIFDKKISDKTTRGYNAEEIESQLSSVKEIGSFKHYYYPPGAKFPTGSQNLRKQSPREILSFLNSHFTESADFFVEIQHKRFKSGRHQIILRGINLKGEITKIAILDFK